MSALPMWLRMSLFSALSMTLMGAALMWISVGTASKEAERQILERQQANIEVAARILADRLDGVTIERGADGQIIHVSLERWPDFAAETDPNHAFIDFVTDVTGETATIFAYDPGKRDFIRRTTNIIKPDGNRAVGTYLGNASAAYEPIMSGTAFLGTAVILGTAYETLYLPILAQDPSVPSSANGVAGILYVGVKSAELTQQLNLLWWELVGSGVLAVLAGGALMALLSYKMLIPLRHAAKQMGALAKGEKVDIIVKRRDEIGQMQSALAELAAQVESAFVTRQIVAQSQVATLSVPAGGASIETAKAPSEAMAWPQLTCWATAMASPVVRR